VKKNEQRREKNRWYIDSRAEAPGVVMENRSAELTETFVRDLSDTHHQLFMMFSLPDNRKTFVCKPDVGLVYGGILSFRPANAQYRNFLSPGCYRGFRVSFDPERFPQITESVRQWDFKVLCNIIGSPMEASLQRMAAEIADPGAHAKALLAGFIEVLIVDLVRLLQASDQESNVRGVLTQEQLHSIMEYVEKRGDSPPTIRELSRVLDMSARHLTRTFKASTGQTIHSFVSQERVRKAIGLLTTTNLAAKEISEKLGYNAPWGFSAAFQKAMGETPTEFRRRFMATQSRSEVQNVKAVRLADMRQ
jgi:AraC-like DNA-binding protein